MKTHIYIIICGLLIFSNYACEDELDSQFPKDKIAQDLLTDSDISKLRNGVYNEMEDAAWLVYFDFDIRAENFAAGPGFGLIDPISMAPESSEIRGLWSGLYLKLRHVNFLIETLDTKSNPQFATTRGEMYYFRAWIYYNLVTRWGGVPILKKRTEDIIQRASEQEVWDFIISDLQVAEQNIGAYSSNWYTSMPAVYALTAKVYLAQKNNAKVIEL